MTWNDVGLALLGSWPSQVGAWHREGIAAYVHELEARGLTPDAALAAIRQCDQPFPPSAGELAAAARHDPDRPTFDEAYRQLYGPGGLFGFKRAGTTVSPWVQAFAENYGADRLRALEVEHSDYGDIKRRELRESWERFVEATEGRELARLVAPRRGEGLAQPDFAGVLGIGREE